MKMMRGGSMNGGAPRAPKAGAPMRGGDEQEREKRMKANGGAPKPPRAGSSMRGTDEAERKEPRPKMAKKTKEERDGERADRAADRAMENCR